jgi:Immunity protein 63
MSASLDTLRASHVAACRRAKVQNVFLVTPQHDGGGHVELIGDNYHYVNTERGVELLRRVTNSEDELLFWLAKAAIFPEAVQWELQNRTPGQDSRRLLFARELELIGSMNDTWVDKLRSEFNKVLKQHPYNDSLGG